MSVVDSTMHVQRPTRTHAYLDLLQMLTGVGLILFMWCHMILVSSVIVGESVMNAIAVFFERTYMAQVGGPMIAACFLLHFLLACRNFPFRIRENKIMWEHSKLLGHRDTWLWLVQVATAMIILLMGAIHMWVVLTNLPITAMKSASRIQGGFWLVFYCLLLPLAELHVSIGFYRLGVKWGLIRRSNRKKYKTIKLCLTVAFILIGAYTLYVFANIELPPSVRLP